MRVTIWRGFMRTAFVTLALSAASPAFASRANTPAPAETVALMRQKGMALKAPVLIRVFKQEAALELWKQRGDGRYILLKTFPVCRWSGQLGPKRKTGDRQTPEGFYDIAPRMMNPNSSYHLSFDTGFPNAYDRANGYTGSYLMVHGVCSSMGCFAMTNSGIEEIYALLRDAFRGGQPSVQLQAFPFRMTARNLARRRDDPDIGFWRQLKAGYDRFEATGLPPKAGVAGKRYVFAPYGDRRVEELATARLQDEQLAIQKQVDDGAPSIRTTYADGGMNPHFARMGRHPSLGIISRPEALALAGREVIIRPGFRKAPAIMTASVTSTVSATFAMYQAQLSSPPLPLRLPAPASVSAGPRIAMAHDGDSGAMASATAPLAAATSSMRTTSSWTRNIVALAMGPAVPGPQ